MITFSKHPGCFLDIGCVAPGCGTSAFAGNYAMDFLKHQWLLSPDSWSGSMDRCFNCQACGILWVGWRWHLPFSLYTFLIFFMVFFLGFCPFQSPLPGPLPASGYVVAEEGYGALASVCFQKRWRLYKVKPKGHMFLHTSILGFRCGYLTHIYVDYFQRQTNHYCVDSMQVSQIPPKLSMVKSTAIGFWLFLLGYCTMNFWGLPFGFSPGSQRNSGLRWWRLLKQVVAPKFWTRSAP